MHCVLGGDAKQPLDFAVRISIKTGHLLRSQFGDMVACHISCVVDQWFLVHEIITFSKSEDPESLVAARQVIVVMNVRAYSGPFGYLCVMVVGVRCRNIQKVQTSWRCRMRRHGATRACNHHSAEHS